jgi:hypothetical protein
MSQSAAIPVKWSTIEVRSIPGEEAFLRKKCTASGMHTLLLIFHGMDRLLTGRSKGIFFNDKMISDVD